MTDEPYQLTDEEWAEVEAVRPDTAAVLETVRHFLSDYMVFSSPHDLTAVTLWVAHTWVLDAAYTTPRLVVQSPSKGTGKSRLLDCLELLCKDSVLASTLTPAVMFRIIEAARPTILQDEADAVFPATGRAPSETAEALRSIYDSGYRRNGYAWRNERVDGTWTPVRFSVFSAAALACIGDLPDTIMDRALVVGLRRKTDDERVEEFDAEGTAERGGHVAELLGEWADTALPFIQGWDPPRPAGLNDRQRDIWRVLLEIACLAGGDWPDAATEAAEAMSAKKAMDDAELNPQMTALRDLASVFADDEDRISCQEAVDRLVRLDQSPWAEVEYGQRVLNTFKLAKLLRGYVKSHRYWQGPQLSGGVQVSGYLKAEVDEAWGRYGPRR